MKKPVWREIIQYVMVHSCGTYQEYYPLHLDRFARQVDSFDDMYKIQDADVGDLVKIKPCGCKTEGWLYICTEIKEIKE